MLRRRRQDRCELRTERSFKHIQDCIGGVGLTNTHVWYWAQPDPSYTSKTINPNASQPATSTAITNPFPTLSLAPAAASAFSPLAQKKKGNKRKQFDRKRLGWLQSTTKIHTLPEGLDRICPGFAFVNSECSGNCGKEHLYFRMLTEAEKEVAKTWVASTAGLDFNRDKLTGGTEATPRHMRPN